jgi:hypothetical protein
MKNQTRRKCIQLLQQAQNNGDLRKAKRIMAMLAVADGTLYSVIATTLKISEESIRLWVNAFLLQGVKSFDYKKPPGKPSKLKSLALSIPFITSHSFLKTWAFHIKRQSL